MVEESEKAIVLRLKGSVPELPVEPFPARTEDFRKLPFQKGILLVAYRSSRFSPPTNTDSIIQERIVEFAVTLQMRDLRGHEGAYGILERVREALTGFAPLGDSRVLYPVEETFLTMTENIWIYGMAFEMRQRQA